MQKNLRLIKTWGKMEEEEIEVGLAGGCRLVLKADSNALDTMRTAARIAGLSVEVYAAMEAAHILAASLPA